VSEPSSRRPVDALWTGGTIWRGEAGTAEALAVDAGRVVAAGPRAELAARFAPRETMDLGGAWMGPGFRDPHGHVLNLGLAGFEAELAGASSPEAVLDRLRAADAGGEWLLGQGYNETAWERVPDEPRAWLDAAFGERPVFLLRVDRHAAWVNSAALARAGITRPGPVSGGLVAGRGGRCTGELVDEAMNLVRAVWPALTPEREAEAWRAAERRLFAEGLTGATDMGLTAAVWRRLLPLYADGRMRLPLVGTFTPEPDTEAFLEREGGIATGRLCVDGVKYYADGALGSRGARLLEPYADAPGISGLWLHGPEVLAAAARQRRARGLRMVCHAIGDAGVRAVLDAYAAAGCTPELGWRVEHAQVTAAADVPRFARMGVWASVQTCHAASDARMAPERLGEARLADAYRARSFLDAGVPLCNGTDFPIEPVSPLRSLATAVWRREPPDGPPCRPEEALTREEALLAMTAWAADADGSGAGPGSGAGGMRRASGAPTGRLDPGAWFDATVLDADPLAVPAEDLARLRVLRTVVRGETVYRAG
jgi:predicted amidohydrolase YtcJ